MLCLFGSVHVPAMLVHLLPREIQVLGNLEDPVLVLVVVRAFLNDSVQGVLLLLAFSMIRATSAVRFIKLSHTRILTNSKIKNDRAILMPLMRL